MSCPSAQKPELYLLNRQDSLSPEKLATLFMRLTGKTVTAEEVKAAMAGSDARIAARKAAVK